MTPAPNAPPAAAALLREVADDAAAIAAWRMEHGFSSRDDSTRAARLRGLAEREEEKDKTIADLRVALAEMTAQRDRAVAAAEFRIGG